MLHDEHSKFVWSEVKKRINRKGGIYGKTFLTKPRWYTQDSVKADHSRFQWKDVSEGRFSLSLLGVINGLLPFGVVLVAHIDENNKEVKGYYFARKWW